MITVRSRRHAVSRRSLMLLEILRLGFAFGVTGFIIWLWYKFMDSVGTF